MRQGGTQKGRDKLSWGKGGGLEGDVEGKEETERECVCVCACVLKAVALYLQITKRECPAPPLVP